jgi:hypothetical protein
VSVAFPDRGDEILAERALEIVLGSEPPVEPRRRVVHRRRRRVDDPLALRVHLESDLRVRERRDDDVADLDGGGVERRQVGAPREALARRAACVSSGVETIGNIGRVSRLTERHHRIALTPFHSPHPPFHSAAGLFHRAVIESRAILRLPTREDATKETEMLLAEMGLKPNQARDLQTIPVEPLLRGYYAAASKFRSSIPGTLPHSPTIDGTAVPGHPFDPKAPAVSADIPLLIGYNRTEETLFHRGNEILDLERRPREACRSPHRGRKASRHRGVPEGAPRGVALGSSAFRRSTSTGSTGRRGRPGSTSRP